MPGPRNNKKTKPKPRPVKPEPFVHAIDEIEGWRSIVNYLCDVIDLPDLSSRSGLKKIHSNFDEIYQKLDEIYAQNRGNDKIMGGVVGIWAKMCVDAVLRNKLVKQGLVPKIMPLLDMTTTRIVGLQALSTITHHGGLEVRVEIAKQTPKLLRLLEDFPREPKVQELVIVTVSHSVGSVVNEENIDHALVKKLEVPRVFRLTLESMQKPHASLELIDHGITLFTSSTRHCFKEIKSQSSLLSFLAACLRVNDIGIRCNALASFIRINLHDSEEENRNFDPNKLVSAVQRQFPEQLVEVMWNYGVGRCETTLLAKTTAAYPKAMMKCAQDKDLYKLGRTLSELILTTEFSISEGGFQAYNERTGQPEVIDIGLPFKMWSDALPHCSKVLRDRGNPFDADLADILDLKYYIIKSRIPEAVAHAQQAIERNPNVGYFYYAISLGADHEKALRAVKKGLKAKQNTPFVYYYMLWRAVCHAGDMGVTILTGARAGEKEYSEGIAFLMSALEDAEKFMRVAPPDARHMSAVVNWYLVLTLAIKGPELSPDLQELQIALKQLDISRQITEHIGFPYKRTQMRLTREMIVRLYPKAIKDYADTIAFYDQVYNPVHRDKEEKSLAEADDTLAAWLDHLTLDEDDDEESHHGSHRAGVFKSDTLHLYRCTYCGNPSAALRKCAGCGNARYCDTSCQKSHWTEHKAACKAA